MKYKTCRQLIIYAFITCFVFLSTSCNSSSTNIYVHEFSQWFQDDENILVITGFPYAEVGLGDAPPYVQKIVKHILRQCEFTPIKKSDNTLEENFSLIYYYKQPRMKAKELRNTDKLIVELDDDGILVKDLKKDMIMSCPNSQYALTLMAFPLTSMSFPIEGVGQSEKKLSEYILETQIMYGYDGTSFLNEKEANKYLSKIDITNWNILRGSEYDKALHSIGKSDKAVILYGKQKDSKSPIFFHIFEKYCIIKVSDIIYVYGNI